MPESCLPLGVVRTLAGREVSIHLCQHCGGLVVDWATHAEVCPALTRVVTV